jgi:hypothetical protein
MEQVRIAVHGPRRPVSFCPVAASVPRSPDELAQCVLIDTSSGTPTPFQIEPSPGGATVHWMVESLAAEQDREYLLRKGTPPAADSQVRIRQDDSGDVSVKIGGKLLTRYVHGDEASKPCLYPVVGPYGEGVTRAYPLEQVEGDTVDHPHHRSLFVAWGDVNGSDNWSEEEGHGRMVHRYFEAIESGCVFGRIVSLNDWVDADGNRLLQDRLCCTFYNLPASVRLFDVDITLYASEGDVRFGDTKEGGMLSVRVASSMQVDRTGRIENSVGGIGESETWGKRASWCDYCGLVGDHVSGLAVFDHPSNLRYPTYWHVRDYGLMTANPFGVSYFVDKSRDGSHVMSSGQNLRFRYRVLVHSGNAREGGVRSKYLEWLFPPTVNVQD